MSKKHSRIQELVDKDLCTYNPLKRCDLSYEKREGSCHKDGICRHETKP